MPEASPFLTGEVSPEGVLLLAMFIAYGVREWLRLSKRPHDPRASREANRRLNYRIHELAGGRVPRNYRTRK